MTSRTGSRAFTLVELLVVIATIAVLAGLLMTALGVVRETARKTQARKEVNEIAGALETYFMRHHGYPPDTADWYEKGGYNEKVGVVPLDKDIDLRSIHRYLASEVRPAPNKEATQQMDLKAERIAGPVFVDYKGDKFGFYTDPWDHPFQVDSVHMYYQNNRWQQKGWPYLRGSSEMPSEQQKEKYVRDFKVVSYGPDGLSSKYPFDETSDAGDKAKMKDDLQSW